MSGSEFVVVINAEEQYSIWPADREVPPGWEIQPMKGDKEACLRFIESHWTDMRPASLRRHSTGS